MEDDDRALAQQLLGIGHRVRHHIDAKLRQLDRPQLVEPSHFPVLARLRRRPYSVSELAERFEVSRPSMSKTVSTLVDRGWVERVRLETDRRVVELHLTDAGQAVLGEMRELALNAVAAMLEPLSPEERQRLADGLAILYRALGEPFDGPHPAPEHRSDAAQEGEQRAE